MNLNNVFYNLPMGVVITDCNFNIRYCNRYVEFKLQLGTDQLKKVIDSIVSGSDFKLEEESIFEKSIYIKEKLYLVQSFKTIREAYSNTYNIVILLLESAELFTTKNQLAENHLLLMQLQAIIDFSYDGIYVTNHDGTTLCVNKSYERITGVKPEEVIGKNIEDLEFQGMFSPIITPSVIKSKEPITVEQTIKTGKKVIITGNPVIDEQGEILYVITNVRDMTEIEQLRDEIDKLKKDKKINHGSIVDRSAAMKQVLNTAAIVSEIDVIVLILGESGVGKEVIAKHIHKQGSRKNGPFVAINCGAIVPTLLESELFGYEGGAFTGALAGGKEGLFETANKGDIFLDEIGDMPLDLQVKLLRVLQEKEIQRVGGNKKIPIDVRVICATNKDLERLVREGSFREDLYYRLNVVSIEVPPLRDRVDDIAPFVYSFTNEFNKRYGKRKTISLETIQALMEYSWPGNVRELRNLIEQLVVLTKEDEIQKKHLPQKINPGELTKNRVDTENGKPLLLLGSNESRPDIIARFIHQASRNAQDPFVVINCNEMTEVEPDSLLQLINDRLCKERELLESNVKLTVYFHKIDQLKPENQEVLLDNLGELQASAEAAPCRLILSHGKDSDCLVNRMHGDQGLRHFYNIIDLTEYNLLESSAGIESLINNFLNEFCTKYNVNKKLSPDTFNALTDYDWQGRVDKLREVIENLVLQEDDCIEAIHLPESIYNSFFKNRPSIEVNRIIPLKKAVVTLEQQLINLALKKHKTTRKAAAELEINQSSVVRKLNRHNRHQNDAI